MIKFLVVDERGMAKQLRDFLEVRGYKAYTATDDKTALKLAREERPNIAILDISLPDLKGPGLLREIKELNSRTHIIVLTAYEDDKSRDMAREVGAFAYITKPYNFDDVLRIAQKLISKIYEEEG